MSMLMAGVAAAGAAVSMLGKGKADRDQKEMAKEAAALELRMTNEEIRRMDEDHKYRMGDISAQVGGSGVKGGSATVVNSMDALDEQHAKDVAWTREVGVSKANQIKDQSSAQSTELQYGMAGDAIGAFGKIGDNNDWWT